MTDDVRKRVQAVLAGSPYAVDSKIYNDKRKTFRRFKITVWHAYKYKPQTDVELAEQTAQRIIGEPMKMSDEDCKK